MHGPEQFLSGGPKEADDNNKLKEQKNSFPSSPYKGIAVEPT